MKVTKPALFFIITILVVCFILSLRLKILTNVLNISVFLTSVFLCIFVLIYAIVFFISKLFDKTNKK